MLTGLPKAAMLFPGTTYQSAEVVTRLHPSSYTAAWRFDNTSALSYAEHVTQISEFGPQTSLYLSCECAFCERTSEELILSIGETYYGIESLAIQTAVGLQLQAAFDKQGLDLKAYSEAQKS